MQIPVTRTYSRFACNAPIRKFKNVIDFLIKTAEIQRSNYLCITAVILCPDIKVVAFLFHRMDRRTMI